MPNVRHHSSRHVRDFSAPTFPYKRTLDLSFSFLFYLFFFFSREKDCRPSNAGYHCVASCAKRGDLHLQKRFSAAATNVRRWRRDLCGTKTYDSVDRRSTLVVYVLRKPHSAWSSLSSNPLRIDRKTRSNQFTSRNFVSDGKILLRWVSTFENFISITSPMSNFKSKCVIFHVYAIYFFLRFNEEIVLVLI